MPLDTIIAIMYMELAIHVDYFITKVNTISKLYVMTYSVEWQRQVVEIMPKRLFMYFDILVSAAPFLSYIYQLWQTVSNLP